MSESTEQDMMPSMGEMEEGQSLSDQDYRLPRITIDAFCESTESDAAIKGAAEDRRWAKARVSVLMGGIMAAVEHYSSRPTPNVILVESEAEKDELFSVLGQLAEVCDPDTKVIVVGRFNDITVYRSLIGDGVSDYLVGPLSPSQIIRSIGGLYATADEVPLGRTIAFVGTRGGVGASTVAHNVGWYLAEQFSEDTTIVDLDIFFGTAGLDFNHDPTQGVVEALIAPDRLDDVLLERLLVKCSERLNVFTAPATLDREIEIQGESVESVLETVRRSVPCVVVDLPHVWSPWSRQVLINADDIIIVATPDLASLRNAKNLVDRLASGRPNDGPPRLVLNQVGIARKPEISTKEFAEALGIEADAILPFDPALFGKAANDGQMIGEVNDSSKPAEAFHELAAILSGHKAVSDKKPTFLSSLENMLRKKGD